MYTKGERIEPRYIEEEIKDSYITYAMSVIVGRALPDARDGLKPVHRRILYAMNELALQHNKPHKKSARIIGETLGKYHPHGDMAVYDALVRMAQDFSLRYPLVDGQGNFGSVDGDAAAAMRYCVSGDTLIITDKGLQRIDSIPHHSEVSFYTLSLNDKINHASKWFDAGEHPTKTVETHRGFSLCGSFNHPILTWQNENGKPRFKWKLLSDVKEGDYAIISRSNLLFPKKDPSLRRHYPKLRKRYEVHELPRFMNEELAFILGAMVSEGYIGKKHVGFCNNDREFIKKFKASFKEVFPDCRLHEFVRKPVGYTKKNYTSLEIHSLYVIEFLKNLGLTPGRAKEKTVPGIIFQSSKKSVAAFLQGFAEGDGSISISSSLRSLEFTFISTSKKLMQELQILLLRFGIDSSYRFQRTRNVFKLFIRNYENLNLFKDQIDFAAKRKQKKLEELSKRNSSGWVMSKMDFIPYLSNYIRNSDKYRGKYRGYREWLIKHNIDRYTKIEKHWPGLKEILDEEDVHLYENLKRNRYIFDKIVSVEDAGIRKVYSIRVDSPCHSFVSNGFISHNTEARMAAIAEEMLKDIDKDTVDFSPNFDDTLMEPTVLPAALPNLLINGSSGIAVGMATNIPPHNLGEVVDGIIKVINEPEASIETLAKIIKGPDFPTGALICGRDGIKNAYLTGRGSLKLHARANIETQKNGRESIIVRELPYQTNKANLISSIASLANDKKIEGISDIRDESDKEGMRIVIDIKRDQPANVVLNQLYRHTQLAGTFGVIMLALVRNQPRVLNLRQLIDVYIEHRREVITRRTKFELAKAQERAHILEGLKIALKHIDKIVKTIKASKSTEDAKNALIKNFELTERQARAILEMQLQRLTALERSKLEAEYLELIKKIEYYQSVLKSEKKILELIKDGLQVIRDKYQDQRRTEIVAAEEELDIEDLIAEEDVVITISHTGYIKRLPVSAYRKQQRGGKGITAAGLKEEDFIEHLFIASTHDYMLFFTDKGKACWLKVHEIPHAGRVSKGKAIVNLIMLGKDEKVTAFVPVRKFDEKLYLTMATKKGNIKRVNLSLFSNPRKAGIIAITLDKDDTLTNVVLTDGAQEIMLASEQGKAMHFKETDIREMGRAARGVRGISLRSKDVVIGMEIAKKDATLLTVTEKGFGKRSLVAQYRLQRRGGKGITNIKISAKNGPVVGIKTVKEEDEVMVITQQGMIVRTPVKSIRATGRSTQGVRLIKLNAKDTVSAIASVVAEEE